MARSPTRTVSRIASAVGVARSVPNGHTLLTTGPRLTYAAELYKKLPFDAKRDLNAVLQDPPVKRSFEATGVLPVSSSVDEFTKYVATETAKRVRVIRSAGIRAD